LDAAFPVRRGHNAAHDVSAARCGPTTSSSRKRSRVLPGVRGRSHRPTMRLANRPVAHVAARMPLASATRLGSAVVSSAFIGPHPFPWCACTINPSRTGPGDDSRSTLSVESVRVAASQRTAQQAQPSVTPGGDEQGLGAAHEVIPPRRSAQVVQRRARRAPRPSSSPCGGEACLPEATERAGRRTRSVTPSGVPTDTHRANRASPPGSSAPRAAAAIAVGGRGTTPRARRVEARRCSSRWRGLSSTATRKRADGRSQAPAGRRK
jgi:hypothetical protein